MCLAIPGKIIAIDDALNDTFRSGKVSFSGIVKNINLSMVPEACIGQYVLVHVGVAISVVDEAEAAITLQYLQQMGEMEELNPQPASP